MAGAATTGARGAMRVHLHGMWDTVAPGWRDHAEYVDDRAARVTAEMLARTAPAAGEHVIDLACGPGGAGIAAARHVGATGRVLLSDVSPAMVTVAAERAAAAGLRQVEAAVRDLEGIADPDGSYDVALCREGLMFVPDPDRAIREIVRVLRPGGRMALAVWGPRERNPWLGLVLDAVAAEIGRPVPPPGVPGPFSRADAPGLARLLTGAGVADVRVDEWPAPLRTATAAEWWERTVALAGPLAAIVAGLPPSAAARLRERAAAAAAPYAAHDGFRFPGLAVVASGRRVAA